MRRSTFHLLVAAVVLVTTTAVAADPPAEPAREVLPMPTPHLRLSTGPGVLEAPNGKLYALPQGSHLLDAEAWAKTDAEMIKLQDQVTNLDAQNKSLRKATEGWQPGWYTLAITLGTGLALGWYVHDKL